MAVQTIGLIGATGMTGSYVDLEILKQGHKVIGISRNPDKLGQHENYTTRSIDLTKASIPEVADALKSVDAVISAYGPHSQLGKAVGYSRAFVESTRTVLIATQAARVPYFFMVGGAGSMLVPDKPFVTAADDPRFFHAYVRDAIASEAYVDHAQKWAGEDAIHLKKAREALLAEEAGTGTPETRRLLKAVHENMFHMDGQVVDFMTGARATSMFFEGNNSIKWTYMSPPPLYRPGRRTGSYEIAVDVMPLKQAGPHNKGDAIFDGRLHGITLPGIAIAIADEVETKEKVGKHWTPYVPDIDNTLGPVYARIGD
ncbi:nad-dependent epimerase dehydratase [Colletotrichum sojae]|uniref:Nad-dependent epimerase dehydratase n=1 Tax=Colletotrichum sojae TaxID=2175907 RepID=A0A8H6ILZ7_9PEZI|nr:nad-dependent epimerase dehydratase [Colletotrichum sojae]